VKNADKWAPSKFVYRRGRLVSSRNPDEVRVASRLMVDRIAALYETHIPAHVRGKLADLGSGKAPLWDAYRHYATEVVCVDWENSLHPNLHLDYQCDLSRKLPFKDREFDTVILSDVIEHIPQPDTLWKEMARILAPGGKALINTPFYYPLHETPHDYYRYTEYALRRLAGLAGLEVLFLKPLGGVPEILADLLARQVQFIPWIGRGLAVAIQGLFRAFTRTPLGRLTSEKTGRAFPFGYFMVVQKTGE
jgi:SAM-dependent methyltransferase